ncbi:TPA: hypothetical protein U5E31_002994 [Yersinia enterocolitica]|uniref:hypothetical protein n=1 Tax=Yersinia enterocolitica TaxID=630 RepID=UPI000A3E5ED1|nr:hypothetical protein [Yersinia enterocolitica]MBX9489829.1 hypothetical protein [Yersinia enterocolitica]MBX9494163.1 hypothetical protein [Yersinia enterocolitica]HDL8054394.1 hypothetical protein [Yersinia enterocolitica]HDM8436719.1 hypothetical protein [Yersinia enterocolitica]HEI6852912.1 hypothetical protein [Yersinia enterocolitica]
MALLFTHLTQDASLHLKTPYTSISGAYYTPLAALCYAARYLLAPALLRVARGVTFTSESESNRYGME